MKRIITTLAIIFSLLGAGGFAMPMPASAQVDTGLNAVGATVGLPTTDPRVIAARIINISLGLLGIIMVSLILYGGFLYMTSAGEADKTEKAKKYIRNAIIGLIIILSSWAIARFVIDNLLKATQEGAVGGGGPSMGTGGGFAGAGVSNVFQVKSITPQGAVSIRNIKIKLLFSRPVDDKSVSAIAITKDGGVGVGGAFEVSGSVVVFTPADACPAPNESLKCFDADSDFTVQVGSELHSTTGQTIVCGGFAPPCTAKFHTGNLIDTQPPKVNMILPLDGQAVPADSLVTLGANATDDSGIAYLAFEDNNNPVDEAAPSASSTPLSFEGQVEWDTTGIPLQSIRQLTAKAFDIDDHSTQSAPVKVVVRSPSCFDGVQNGDETAVDCGGTPNTPGYCGACSGGSCVGNSDCASSVCQAGKCVEQPTITGITPQDGAAGSFVTIKGLNFGTAGTVVFLGGAGAGDDKIAKLPLSCTLLGMAGWSPTEVIVAVPDGAASGPLSLTNSISGLSDATDDSRGPLFQDFTVNDNLYPGLCGLDPTSGFAGDQFKAIGQGFGTAPDAMQFGASSITSFSSWTDNQIVANVPVVGVGKHAVKVKVGANYSNPVNFNVSSKATAGPPVILSLDPSSGPRGEYITLLGNNFGYSVGTVRFKNKTTEQEALGDTIFPPVCAEGYWTGNNVVVKVPQEFLINKTTLIAGDYSVRLVRSDNSESNAMDFVVTAGNAKPGICAISPTVGPVGTAVTLNGERFGSDTGIATFYTEKAGVVSSWSNGEVKTGVPAGAVTGPVTLSAQGVKSNSVNFQVRNCNEEPGVCSLKE
ncbi:IPT/TIG domain-containing protein, partial [Patescibacteria group bacterium]|nr:IPT/TIG domain-containing protein [Patescibacteria group bacterium]